MASSITITEEDGLRMLGFGTRWCQGMMRIAEPDALELEYAVRMFAWLLFREPDDVQGARLVTLGLGAGSLTRFAHRVLRMRTTAVEIDDAVIAACREHFMLQAQAGGPELLHADGGAFVQEASNAGRFDVIQVDAYDARVQAPALDTEAFYADCGRCLRPGGTLAVNLVGEALDARASVARVRAGLQAACVWQFPPTPTGNVVVIAHGGVQPEDALLTQRASIIEARWGLPASRWCASARRWVRPAGVG